MCMAQTSNAAPCCLRCGPCHACSKPVMAEELLTRMATHLDLRQDAPGWMQLITGSPSKLENESMRLLRSILPDQIIRRMKEVSSLLHFGAGCSSLLQRSQLVVAASRLCSLLQRMHMRAGWRVSAAVPWGLLVKLFVHTNPVRNSLLAACAALT